MTTGQIMTALAGITYSSTSHTVVERFQNHNEEFEDFTIFPVVVVTDGPEEDDWQANNICLVSFHPEVHFYAEGQTAAQMKTWRDDIRNAIYNSATLESYCMEKRIDRITVSESENRKLQRVSFFLTITFDKSY